MILCVCIGASECCFIVVNWFQEETGKDKGASAHTAVFVTGAHVQTLAAHGGESKSQSDVVTQCRSILFEYSSP